MLLAWLLTNTSHHPLAVAHSYQEAVFVRTWSVLQALDGENSETVTAHELPFTEVTHVLLIVPFTIPIHVHAEYVGQTGVTISQLHSIDVQLIVLILTALTNSSCFQSHESLSV
jgi:hypothetical protein